MLHKHTGPLVELVNQFLKENFDGKWSCFFVPKGDLQENRLKGQVSIELNGYECNDDRSIWKYTIYLPRLNCPIMEAQTMLDKLGVVLNGFGNQIAIKNKVSFKDLSISVSLVEYSEVR